MGVLNSVPKEGMEGKASMKNGKGQKGEIACKICGEPTRLLTDPKSGEAFRVCPGCAYIFREKSLLSAEDEKKRYLSHNNTWEDEGYRTFLESFLKEAVLPLGRRFERALDFGSGPEPVLARIMVECYGIPTEIYDLYFAPETEWRRRTYDLIVSTEVFEHLSDPLTEMRALSGRLSKGGLLAVMTRFHYADDAAFLAWHYRRDKTHIGFFSEKTLRVLGRLAGLDMIHTDGKRHATFRKK